MAAPEVRVQRDHDAHQQEALLQALKLRMPLDLAKSIAGRPNFFTSLTAVQERIFELMPDVSRAGLAQTSKVLPDGGGRDLLVKARTGTGKTVAFLAPAIASRLAADEALERRELTSPFARFLEQHGKTALLDGTSRTETNELQRLFGRVSVGVLVISPTRELALQIARSAESLLSRTKLKVHALIGGESASLQRRAWMRYRRDVVVATPGRLLDFLNDDAFREAVSMTQTIVLDEADMLLELGFRDDVQSIMAYLPPAEERATMLFSATVSKSIEAIARNTLHPNHRFIDCVPPGEENVHRRIPQHVSVLNDPSQILPHLVRLMAHDQLLHGNKSKIMVFTPTTKFTQMVSKMLAVLCEALPAGRITRTFEIHSGLDQKKRSRVSQNFRSTTDAPSVLVTSDVSARGVDYPGVTRVIQLGIPPSTDMYIHRVGRTGRGGGGGRADLILMDWESAFATFGLRDVPTMPLDADALAAEVAQLAAKADSSGRPSWKSSRFSAPGEAAPRLSGEALATTVAHARSLMSDEASYGVFMGSMGYYLSHTDLLRQTKGHVFQALLAWVTAVTSLSEPPKMTPLMRQMVGGSGLTGKQRRGGRDYRSEPPRRRMPAFKRH